MKFKVGDKVKILPSAMNISVGAREIGKITKIKTINSPNDIMIYDSRGKEYGCWCVNDYNIALVIVKGQQLLFDFMSEAT